MGRIEKCSRFKGPHGLLPQRTEGTKKDGSDFTEEAHDFGRWVKKSLGFFSVFSVRFVVKSV